MPRERMGSMMLQDSRPAAVPGHPRHGFDMGRSFSRPGSASFTGDAAHSSRSSIATNHRT